MNPFEFIVAVSESKKNLFEDPLADKDYKPFMVNRGLSYFHDTILYANEMNRRIGIPNEWQFAFLLNSISKKKRYSKWVKKDSISQTVEDIKTYYCCSTEIAKQYMDILTEDQVTFIQSKLIKGGR